MADNDKHCLTSKNVYLFVYNVCIWFGYLLTYPSIVFSLFDTAPTNGSDLIETIGSLYSLLVILSCLEIVHVGIGLVPGHVLFPTIQIGFKLLVLFGFIVTGPGWIHSAFSVRILLLVWTTGELIRYPFYALSVLNVRIGPITWLRYSAWIVLYPIGILSEAMVIYQNLPQLKTTHRFSIALPNPANFSFYAPYAVWTYLGFFVWLGSYIMLSHMARQRYKVLNVGRPIPA